jgi:hypothetical protein
MSANPTIDGVLVQWGERLFYPGNRTVRSRTPRLGPFRSKAEAIRSRIEATVRRAPQVMVKVTGGGRGMQAIAAHFRYISKNGRLEIEDDRGVVEQGRGALKDIERQWCYGGAYIDDVGHRREALNIMLSMPKGTDAQTLLRAAREFAKIEFADHRYVMVLHTHQAHPHVHLSVKVESKYGERLNPRKADLHRWRETFAERLREWGVDAEASRQAARGVVRNYPDLWRKKAAEEGRERQARPERKKGGAANASRKSAGQAWAIIAQALRASPDPKDQRLALDIERFVTGRTLDRQVIKDQTMLQRAPQRDIGPSR